MPKPICVVKIDNRKQSHLELFQVQIFLEERLPDYHVLVVPFEQSEDECFEPIQFEIFYDKDFTDIQFEELKKIVIGIININKSNEQGIPDDVFVKRTSL